jgi:prolyl-tRNA synthetase
MPSHKLLLRAGFIRQLASGIYTNMPLGFRSITKIENIIREEMDAIGGQEIKMPVVHPADLWQETGRWFQIGSEMGRFKDRNDRDMVLAMTHEEVVADLARKEIHSYRQLPVMVYHIQIKWRDDPRPRAGLIRVREFTMKDSYTLDADWEGLDKQYRDHYQAYFNIFHRCGIPVIAVKSDVGMMGGKLAHEFMYLTPFGEDTLLLCECCSYSANRQVATFRKTPAEGEKPQDIQKIPTPDTKTIAELARFLDIPESKTAKAILMVAEIPDDGHPKKHFVFAVLRGDMVLNETKLVNALKAVAIRPALDDEIISVGAVPGYASPLGLSKSNQEMKVIIIVDDLIPVSANLVVGANELGFHQLNVNYGRDYSADIVADIAAARDGDLCPNCGKPMKAARGVEVGNIFKLGTRYSESLGCFFQDKDGVEKPIVMGSYGIGSGRLLAAIAEENNDEYGLIWPITVAPFQVHLITLPGKLETGSVEDIAAEFYGKLTLSGIEVLFDDRGDSPGVKFNDADLIGIPIRVTISARNLKQGLVELKRRDQDERHLIPLDAAIDTINNLIKTLELEVTSRLVEIPLTR